MCMMRFYIFYIADKNLWQKGKNSLYTDISSLQYLPNNNTTYTNISNSIFLVQKKVILMWTDYPLAPFVFCLLKFFPKIFDYLSHIFSISFPPTDYFSLEFHIQVQSQRRSGSVQFNKRLPTFYYKVSHYISHPCVKK